MGVLRLDKRGSSVETEGTRLQKVLAQAGVASRRRAEELIREGKVYVNGIKVEALGVKVGPTDEIRVEGRMIQGRQAWHYYLLNKPCGVMTTAQDPQGRTTVLQLLGALPVRVYPVGRLDYDTSGLLLLTNDGELAHRLAHPRYGVDKTYRVWVEHAIPPARLKILAHGIELEDGKTAPAKVRVIRPTPFLLEITIHEGKNRQVRRMFAAIGHPVLRLERIRYGPLVLEGDLKAGAFRLLTKAEIKALRQLVGLAGHDDKA
ncbi:MAG: pseudouridine synthase [Desulfitobacteriaceae bacterium]|nr:pseudouridine synthase [Desulfitobacteriaceae bacterium]MDI6878845.1 pseudouridine synthase [Desulfitobacteriaceae bacterium]MDI6914602.1 pseudouridine synthase [Desulfitobacteriaceae bacterium]